MKTPSLFFTCLFAFASTLSAQRAGDLDATFNGGKVTVDRSPVEFLTRLAVQPDGKIIAGGMSIDTANIFSVQSSFFLARFKPNGSLDASFASGGILNTGFQSELEPFAGKASFALQHDGKIVVAGVEHEGIIIMRYNSDGSLDHTFNKVVVSDSGLFQNPHLLMRSDGDIVLVITRVNETKVRRTDVPLPPPAHTAPDSTGEEFTAEEWEMEETFMYKYEWDCSIVMVHCGTDGKIENRTSTPISEGAQITSAVIQPDNKIVVTSAEVLSLFSFMPEHELSPSIGLVRLNEDGTIDNTFGTEGIATHKLSSKGSIACAVALQSNGKIVLTGLLEMDMLKREHAPIAVARFNSDGSADAGFGTDGVRMTMIDSLGIGTALLVQPDDKIVVAGFAGADEDLVNFALVRYHADGNIDHSFGNNGVVITRFGDVGIALAIAQQPDGKIIVGGTSATRQNKGDYDQRENLDIALARYISEDGSKANGQVGAETITVTSNSGSDHIYQFTLKADGNITVEVYDIGGRLIMTPIKNERRSAGTYSETLHFDDHLPSGRYLVRLTTSGGVTSMWVMKQ